MVDAVQIVSRQYQLGADASARVVIWRLPRQLRGSGHNYKYRLALIVDGICVMRFDNEDGKGDHKHVGKREFPYDFVGIDELQRDFDLEARRWILGHPRG